MANSPSVRANRSRLSIWTLVACLLASAARVPAADNPSPVQPLRGPAVVELERGKIWLSVPADFRYVVDPADLRRVLEIDGFAYDSSHLAVVCADDGRDIVIAKDNDPVDEADWKDAPAAAWKEHAYASLQAWLLKPDAKGHRDDTVRLLGWYAEPTFAPGPPRRACFPAMLQAGKRPAVVLVGGVVGTAERQVNVITSVQTELAAEAVKHVEAVTAAVSFSSPAAAHSPLDKLNWKHGPASVVLERVDASVSVPAGFVYLSEPSGLAAYDAASGSGPTQGILMALAPESLDWVAVVRDMPDGLGPNDGTDPLVRPGKDTLLATFRSTYEGNAADPGLKVLGFQGEPAYTPGFRRSLHVPLLYQCKDGSVGVSLLDYVASPTHCVLLGADVRSEFALEVSPRFRALSSAIQFGPPPPAPAASERRSAPPVAQPASRPPNAAPLVNAFFESKLGKAIGAAIGVVAVFCFAAFKTVTGALWRATVFVFGLTAPSSRRRQDYGGSEPPPLYLDRDGTPLPNAPPASMLSWLSRIIAALVVVVAGLVIIAYVSGAGTWIGESWLASHPAADPVQAFNSDDALRRLQGKYQEQTRQTKPTVVAREP